MPAETISPEQAASFVKSGMWLDYGATHCEPDVFDRALAARKDELENVKIRSDPRMLATIGAILKSPRDGGLVSDSLVYRYPPQPRIDGLPGEEGTFNMCSFWLVGALTRAGSAFPEKLDQARLLFERVLGYANHLGLYSEQTGSRGRGAR